jgi:hypothetical protein
VLMQFARHAKGHDAVAIASAMSHRALLADALTKELLSAVTDNPAVLSICISRGFTRDLQELLLSPGCEELVLEVAERCTELLFAKHEPRVQMPFDESFVSIAVALQRSGDPLRNRAMDLYEKLLDGAAYGAEDAATASLSRN